MSWALIVYFDLLLTPSAYIALQPSLCILSLFWHHWHTLWSYVHTVQYIVYERVYFDTSDMSNITLYTDTNTTFNTSNMSNIALYWRALYALFTPSTRVTLLHIEGPVYTFNTSDMSNIPLYWGAYPSNYTVDPNMKSSNYNKIWLKALNYFNLDNS